MTDEIVHNPRIHVRGLKVWLAEDTGRVIIETYSLDEVDEIYTLPGVYACYDENEKILYIGQAGSRGRGNTYTRVSQHLSHRNKKGLIAKIVVIYCHKSRLDYLEDSLIDYFRPPYNWQSRSGLEYWGSSGQVTYSEDDLAALGHDVCMVLTEWKSRPDRNLDRISTAELRKAIKDLGDRKFLGPLQEESFGRAMTNLSGGSIRTKVSKRGDKKSYRAYLVLDSHGDWLPPVQSLLEKHRMIGGDDL